MSTWAAGEEGGGENQGNELIAQHGRKDLK